VGSKAREVTRLSTFVLSPMPRHQPHAASPLGDVPCQYRNFDGAGRLVGLRLNRRRSRLPIAKQLVNGSDQGGGDYRLREQLVYAVEILLGH